MKYVPVKILSTDCIAKIGHRQFKNGLDNHKVPGSALQRKNSANIWKFAGVVVVVLAADK